MAGPPPLTPLLEQYERVKAQYPGHLVLFRVGDFYETYGEDAQRLSQELEIVLTARSPDAHGERTPMAGVPYHAVDSYLGRLLRRGYKVAICDQVEDSRSTKRLVRREVTRVVTPGTVLEDRVLRGPEHNFLACVVGSKCSIVTVAALDVTTAEMFVTEAPAAFKEEVASILAPFDPSEILVATKVTDSFPGIGEVLRREFPRARIEPAPLPAPPDSTPRGLDSLAGVSVSAEEAGRRLLSYLTSTQPRLVPFVEFVSQSPGTRGLRLDSKTLRHLEISRPMNPDALAGPTLLSTHDETVSALGRRTLTFWLRHPLADASAIRSRQEIVAAWADRGADLLKLRAALSEIPDISRIAARLVGRRVRPPELLVLASGLEKVAEVRAWISGGLKGERTRELLERLDPLPSLSKKIRASLVDPAPPTLDARGVFRPGVDAELDRWRAEEQSGLAELEALEHRESERSGIRSLKVGFNQVFGYYFEVTRAHLARVPVDFRRKQTLSSAERFTTEDLDRIAERVLGAREKLSSEESGRWETWLQQIESEVARLHRTARVIGEVDALASFAHLAQTRGYRRPEVNESRELIIREGRHPVLSQQLGADFVPNDTELSPQQRLLLLTGPNMSGKSTYMRQVGLIIVLAQAGAFVPASYARIGLVTSLFTRMGFTDEIGRGKSSFLVEMSEVADILRSADERSLVLLDEVGRGTSTFDGLALAWATLRHMHDRLQCRAIVATHYHQLTDLVGSLTAARNAHLSVEERPDGIVFLRHLVPGSTDRSYGLHVARLAGVPSELIAEAERLLKRLEREMPTPKPPGRRRADLPRYTQGILLPAAPVPRSELEQELERLDPERMAPFDALEWIRDARARRAPRPPS